MTKTLVVPDIHEEIDRVDYILSKFEYDKVVFLGDYFDKFGAENTSNTCHWLLENIDNPNYTFLIGNHDQHYLFGVEKCSGYTKHNLISTLLISMGYNKLRLVHWVDNWLLSHAGVDKSWVTDLEFEQYANKIGDLEHRALQSLSYRQSHPFIKAGWDRGGSSPIGGVNWIDWKELSSIPGINQLVGHTHRKGKVRFKEEKNSKNYCIDTGLQHVAIIENSEIKIFEV